MKKVIFATAIALGLISCDTDEITVEQGPVEVVQLASGILDGAGEEGIPQQNIVIGDRVTWNALLDKMNSVNNETDTFVETEVDFESFLVLASFEEVKPTAGFGIEIVEAVQNENTLNVTVNEIEPGEGDEVPTVITQPYNIVKILRVYSPIIFE